MSEIETKYCHLHPDRPTFRSCSRCDRPTCSACLRDAPVGQHCLSCIKAEAPSAAAQTKRATVASARRMKMMDMPVTGSIVALNIAVFVMTELTQAWSSSDLALYAGSGQFGGIGSGEWWRIVTSGFIHYSPLHIGFNMFALWQLGRFLEPSAGWPRFTALYVVCLLGGSLGALIASPYALTGGASGAVFGLAGASTVALRRRGVPFNNTWGPMLVINLVLSFAIPNVSIGGHLGGLVVGGVLGATILAPKRQRRSAQLDLIALAVLGLVLTIACIVIAKHPINGEGLWPK